MIERERSCQRILSFWRTDCPKCTVLVYRPRLRLCDIFGSYDPSDLAGPSFIVGRLVSPLFRHTCITVAISTILNMTLASGSFQSSTEIPEIASVVGKISANIGRNHPDCYANYTVTLCDHSFRRDAPYRQPS